MDSILKFKEAAKDFQKSESYLALETARKTNDANEVLQEMMRNFTLARVELEGAMAEDPRDDAKVNELNTQMSTQYNAIMETEGMVSYTKAKQEVESFIEYINAVLNAAIEGGDPMAVEEPQPDCCSSGGCGSCGGGCH